VFKISSNLQITFGVNKRTILYCIALSTPHKDKKDMCNVVDMAEKLEVH